jgi:hypothetical protein
MNEEDIDTDEAAGSPRKSVIRDHGEDRDASKSFNTRR